MKGPLAYAIAILGDRSILRDRMPVPSLAASVRTVKSEGATDADIFQRCACGCGDWAAKPIRRIRDGKLVPKTGEP